jgi:hypothetical protein
MKNFILQLTTGGKWIINQQEAELIAKAESDLSITITRLGIVAPKRMMIVYPQSSSEQIEARKEIKRGFLHDGTKVIRQFGEIVCDQGQVVDDNGNYKPVRPDSNYYPEVAKDCFFSPEEWENVKLLTLDERKNLILGLLPSRNENIENRQIDIKKLSENFSM